MTADLTHRVIAGAHPELTPIANLHRAVDACRPLDEAHRASNAFDVSQQQVVQGHLEKGAKLLRTIEVDGGDIRKELFDQGKRGGVVDVENHSQVEVQIVGEELHCLGRTETLRSVFGEECIDEPVDRDTAAHIPHFAPTLGDREIIAHAIDIPVVDRLGNDCDAGGSNERFHGEELILIEDALGESNSVIDQHAASVDLVDADRVVDERKAIIDRVEHGGLMAVLAPAYVLSRARVDALDDTAAQVGIRGLDSEQQVLRGMTFVFVIGVAEHHPATGSFGDSAVARCAAAAGVLLEPHVADTRVGRGRLRHDIGRVIGRRIVNDDDFQR